MLKMASKKTKVVSGRITYDIAKEMKKENLSVNEAIQIALSTKKSPEKLLKAQLQSLLSENELLASKLALNNILIEELLSKLEYEGTLDELKEELFVSENDKAIQTTLERYNSMKGTSNLPIGDFINSRKGKQIINSQLSKCDLTKEDFIDLLIERHEKSRQTTLD